ncbi:MAG: tryptophan transporter [Terrisporobacter sp.]
MNRNENTKNMIMNALLLGIGALLHQITPALGLPMQPDFALAMLFIIMILNRGKYKTCLVAAIITGIFTAMTTKFPGGQIPNVIDKLVTINVVFVIMMIMDKINVIKNMTEEKRRRIESFVIFPIGTLVSGVAFLGSASVIVGLPVSFISLFITVVVPAVIVNLVGGMVLFKVINTSMKRAITS